MGMKKMLSGVLAAAMVLGNLTMAMGEAAPAYSEEKVDNWVRVIAAGVPELGYNPDSGVKLLEADGLVFKDLDQDGELDVYEDWREDANTRAADLVSKMTLDEIAGLMVYSGSLTNNMSGKLDDTQVAALDDGLRGLQNGAVTYAVKDQVKWSNAIQAYAESGDHGIPALVCSDPRNSGWGKGVSDYPDNLALAATFDTENVFEAYQQMAKEYRALGITTLLGPQVDLDSEPRWGRNSAAFGESPALSRDMANAATSALQSTYDEEGNDLGWGKDSVLGMLKHFPGDGAAQDGREAHDPQGAYNIYPGENFAMHLVSFIDGGLNLNSVTREAASFMTSYSVAYTEDEAYGELVATAYSDYKIGLLRSYGFDGVVCTDWAVLDGKNYGVENLEPVERVAKALAAGVDQFGGESDLGLIRGGIALFIEDGEEEAEASVRNSGRRILKQMFQLGLFENPYLELKQSVATVFSKNEEALKMQEKTIVMLKNDGAIAEHASDDKPTVYVPLVFTPATEGFVGQNFSSADMPVDIDYLSQYFNVVTDTVSETLTGPADQNGNPTLCYDDIIRASAEELAACDMALVFARTPKNTTQWHITGGYNMYTGEYIPLSLQYGEYVADGEYVDKVSVAGQTLYSQVQTPYGTQTVSEQENQSYYGKTASIDNVTDLTMIQYAVDNMPESTKIVVAMNTEGKSPVAHMVMSEFEADVDAILYGFNVNNQAFVAIAAGETEPTALLPIQLPASMEAVEKQLEDVPRDMECYVDSMGNTYDFAFGLNWSGKIDDERVEKYYNNMPTAPQTKPVQ